MVQIKRATQKTAGGTGDRKGLVFYANRSWKVKVKMPKRVTKYRSKPGSMCRRWSRSWPSFTNFCLSNCPPWNQASPELDRIFTPKASTFSLHKKSGEW